MSTITDLNNVRIPKNKARRHLLLCQIHDEAYQRGFDDGKKLERETTRRIAEEKEALEKRLRANSIQALSNIGDSLARVATALADTIEPRRI